MPPVEPASNGLSSTVLDPFNAAAVSIMSRPSDDKIIESIRLYRQTLQDTKALYIDGGKVARGSYGWLTGEDNNDAASLADQMDFLRAHFPRTSPLHQRLAV